MLLKIYSATTLYVLLSHVFIYLLFSLTTVIIVDFIYDCMFWIHSFYVWYW